MRGAARHRRQVGAVHQQLVAAISDVPHHAVLDGAADALGEHEYRQHAGQLGDRCWRCRIRASKSVAVTCAWPVICWGESIITLPMPAKLAPPMSKREALEPGAHAAAAEQGGELRRRARALRLASRGERLQDLLGGQPRQNRAQRDLARQQVGQRSERQVRQG